jgi:acyl carrier protein phosphodiesterase
MDMNYLAHALLSGDNPGVLIGNMAADSLKGRLPPDLLPAVIRGVHLHREIDRYTDDSDEFTACKAVFESGYGRYAHVLVDIAFDHFLCKSWHLYCGHPFPSFVKRVYAVLLDSNRSVPNAFIPIAKRMRSEDWLTSYGTLTGVAAAYERVGRRFRLAPGYLARATILVEERRDSLGDGFNSLFPKVLKRAVRFREEKC